MGYKRKEYENMENLFTNGKKKFVKYEEGAAMYSMGIHAFTELAKEAKAIYRMQVYEAYSSSINVFAVEIPLSVRAAEISAEGSSIYEYDPKGKAAFAYTALIKEVINHGE